MRAIVTGGAGFIGSHVVEALLARGDEVAVDRLSRPRQARERPAGAELHVRDIREPLDDLFDDVRPEAVFHLAAQVDVRVSVEHPVEDAAVNVLGTVRVLEAARRHGAQVVFTSTGGAIYGECDEPAREDAPCEPLSPYGTAKLAGEEYLAPSTGSTGRGTSRCATATSTARARIRTARQASSRSSSARSRAASRRRSSATACRRATTSTSATSRARRLAARTGRRRLQRRHRTRDVGRRAVRAVREGRRLGHARPSMRPRASASSSAASSIPSAPRTSSGSARGRARGRSARDLGLDSRHREGLS